MFPFEINDISMYKPCILIKISYTAICTYIFQALEIFVRVLLSLKGQFWQQHIVLEVQIMKEFYLLVRSCNVKDLNTVEQWKKKYFCCLVFSLACYYLLILEVALKNIIFWDKKSGEDVETATVKFGKHSISNLSIIIHQGYR